MKYFMYRSKKDPTKYITVGQRSNGTLFISGAKDVLTDEQNVFNSIEEIEQLVQDEFEMIRKEE